MWDRRGGLGRRAPSRGGTALLNRRPSRTGFKPALGSRMKGPHQVTLRSTGWHPAPPRDRVWVAECRPRHCWRGTGKTAFPSPHLQPFPATTAWGAALRRCWVGLGSCGTAQRATASGTSSTRVKRAHTPPHTHPYKTVKAASYKGRTGEETKSFISPDLSQLSLPVAGGNYKELYIRGSQFRATRTSPTDKRTRTATLFVPWCTSKQENPIPASQRNPAPRVPVSRPLPHSIQLHFLPLCSGNPSFADKMQPSSKLTFLHDSPRVPADLSEAGTSRGAPFDSPGHGPDLFISNSLATGQNERSDYVAGGALGIMLPVEENEHLRITISVTPFRHSLGWNKGPSLPRWGGRLDHHSKKEQELTVKAEARKMTC